MEVWRQVETHAIAIRAESLHSATPFQYLTAEALIRKICVRMHVNTFDELNVGPPHAIVPIREVLDIEHDLWEFVGMYVSIRAISTVHEAELEFLRKHRAESFVSLGIGTHFSAAPAVVYHFNIPPASHVLPLTTKEVLSHLNEFRFQQQQRYQDTRAFLGHVAQKLSLERGTVLGVQVQNMHRSLELMRRVQLEERKQLKDIENEFRRDIANSVFQLTKEKFSSENREKAVAEALATSKIEMPNGEQKANVAVKLAADILQKVTVLDSHLDRLIGKYSNRLPKDTSSVIAKQDLKLRGQIVHKKHEGSRSTVVTWVLCSIIAKSRALLDAKRLSPEGLKNDNDDEEECNCCCVGKESCTCSCECECHAAGSDDDESEVDDEKLAENTNTPEIANSIESKEKEVIDLRERCASMEKMHPQYSILQLLEAVEKESDRSDKTSPTLLNQLAKLDEEQPLFSNQTKASSFSPEHVHALVYQCRLVQNEFQPEPSQSFEPFLRQVVQTEAPQLSRLPNELPLAAPFYSLYFSSPLTTAQSHSLSLPQLLEVIEALPCLIDIEAAVHWHVAEHGPLVSFFLANFPHIPLLQLPSGRCMKLQANASVSLFQSESLPPHKVAALYVSIFVLSNGKCDWKDVKQALESTLQQASDPPAFALQVLLYIPHVFHHRLIPPLLAAVSSVVHHVHQALHLSCTTDYERAVLYQLGHILDVPAWKSLQQATELPTQEKIQPPIELLNTTANEQSIQPIQTELENSEKLLSSVDSALCKVVIEDIRKNSFGFGLPASDETQNFLRLQQNRLERALQRLSAELYSTATHFVLELLQNANDNQYAPKVAPRAEIVVTENAISFYCNEIGFQAHHIRALCDVGASTKSTGMIGQKGIGFKSVFSISDRPEIHSNGYHVHFDSESRLDNVRYILPYWIANPAPEFLNKSGTWFHLPLKNKTSSSQKMLETLEPSTLLFLNKIISLKISNRLTNVDIEYRKEWLSEKIVLLHSNTQDAQQWYVERKAIPIPPSFVNKGSSTLLEIAFPLSNVTPQNQPVFAFLPLQTYGFKFILQANFELPSSREAILDNSWNQFILENIPKVFTDTLVSLLYKYPHLIQMVPLEIAPPFHSVAQAICRQLQDLAIIQTTSGEFFPPRHVIDRTETDVVSDELLWESCRKRLIHPVFDQHLTPQLKKALGILPWNSTHLIQIAKTVSSKQNLTLDWYAQFMDLLASLNPFAAQVIPLTLFPVQTSDNSQYSLRSLSQNLFYPVESFTIQVPFSEEMNILHPEWIHALHPRTIRFLAILGVKQLTRQDVLQYHLLPLMKTKSSKHDHIKALNFCLHLHLEQPLSTSVIKIIRQAIQVETTSNAMVLLSTPELYLLPPQLSFPRMEHIHLIPWNAQTFSFFQFCGVQVFLSLNQANVCPGLESILEIIIQKQDISLASALLQYLDRNWTIELSTYSSIISALQKSEWFPVATPQQQKSLMIPNETYLNVPAALMEYFPSPTLLNRELALALSIKSTVGFEDYITLLQSNIPLDKAMVCFMELKDLIAAQPEYLPKIQTAFTSTPLIPVNDQMKFPRQLIWKASTSCPSLIALRPTYPKALKSFFIDLGVPVKLTRSTILTALNTVTTPDERIGQIKLLASQAFNEFPSEIENIPFLTTVTGRLVSFGDQPLLVSSVPSWCSSIKSKIFVDIQHPKNVEFSGLWRFGIFLEQDINDNAEEWNSIFECAIQSDDVNYDS
ncbi:hypothetical protein LEN26_001525, partial [Aphanomyces euteiches]